MFDFLKGKSCKSFDPYNYSNGSQRERLLQVLEDFEVVPLPFFLRMEPRIAGHTALISKSRQQGYIIENKTIEVLVGDRYETHSFYQLLKKPTDAFAKESTIQKYIDEHYPKA